MRSPWPTLLALLPAIAVAVALSGCTSPAASKKGPSAAPAAPQQASGAGAAVPTTPPPPPPGVPLEVGLNAAQVEQLVGKPAEVRPLEANDIKAEVWVYLRAGVPVTREVTTGVREIHWVDPISGRELTRQEPIIGYETETPQLELRLLMFHGKLVNWSQVVRGSDRSFN